MALLMGELAHPYRKLKTVRTDHKKEGFLRTFLSVIVAISAVSFLIYVKAYDNRSISRV